MGPLALLEAVNKNLALTLPLPSHNYSSNILRKVYRQGKVVVERYYLLSDCPMLLFQHGEALRSLRACGFHPLLDQFVY